MSDIKSDLFSKNVQNRQMRHIEVEDPSQASVESTSFGEENFDEINKVLAARGQAPLPSKNAVSAPTVAPEGVKEIAGMRQSINATIKYDPNAKISSRAKSRIEAILGMYSKDTEVVVGGMTFTLNTLSADETKEVFLAIPIDLTPIELTFKSRAVFLAKVVKRIDGHELSSYIESSSFEEDVAFFESLPEVLAERLYQEYLKMITELNSKYSMTAASGIQEVMSDLKK
jgi:hypothetical protein